MKTESVKYTTFGSVRRGCGHKHITLSGAIACIRRDHAGCVKQGGYSDRQVERCDGEELTEEEKDLINYGENT